MRYAPCGHRGSCECAKWEARLKAEGLAHLDYADGDDIVVGNKGSGKPDADMLDGAREAGAASLDADRDFLRGHRFRRRLDKQIWELHCDGWGWRIIAQRLRRCGQKTVKPSLARTKALMRRRKERRVSIHQAARDTSPAALIGILACL